MASWVRSRRRAWNFAYRTAPRYASEFRRAQILFTHGHCRVKFNGPVRLGPGFHLDIPDSGSFIVGSGVDFRRGFVCEISGEGVVKIGDGSIFTSNVLIQCSTSIEIGERFAFGQSVLIVDGYHRYEGTDSHWLDQGYDYRSIRIGNGAGISDKCTIQADIGERAMIASHSVVNRPIPPFSVAAGCPARVIRRFDGSHQRSDGATGNPTDSITPSG